MIREDAIRIFRKEIECLSHTKCEDCILEKACDPMNTTPYDSEYIEAYSMAIKALEQELVLDELRAEIEELDRFYDNDCFSGNRDSMFKCNEVMEILNKYKADKEQENE